MCSERVIEDFLLVSIEINSHRLQGNADKRVHSLCSYISIVLSDRTGRVSWGSPMIGCAQEEIYVLTINLGHVKLKGCCLIGS